MKPELVILPGLDGTGLMLEEVSALLEAEFRVTVLRYPTTIALGYDGLLAVLHERLPDRIDCLVAESFAGPLALRLAAERPDRIGSLVLVTSFARLDLPFKGLLRRFAESVPANRVPSSLLAWLLMGEGASAERLDALRGALAGMAPNVLESRAWDALNVDLVASRLRVPQPLLYLKASSDRLMPRSAPQGVASLADAFESETIEGAHFLLQVAPEPCARAILAFRERLAHAGTEPR